MESGEGEKKNDGHVFITFMYFCIKIATLRNHMVNMISRPKLVNHKRHTCRKFWHQGFPKPNIMLQIPGFHTPTPHGSDHNHSRAPLSSSAYHLRNRSLISLSRIIKSVICQQQDWVLAID
ncbi:hypothetical protein EYC80_007528 [Monilinia laxa]|uniref:Uncharacterized protein n=1 Tax=Monilinia laxa TaxID=61186 RepID=A0A5N6JW72_MONLA|nr:hypothetical protein EYC80_007528 [Monilinia laxa]